uniref:Uncharacterized protein n=1 Tax=viral metagenome TaxID=1070528 RepID=A0A6C0IAU2_9ZZZZ
MGRTQKNSYPPVVQKPAVLAVNSQRPTFGQTMKEGFGLGVGVSVAQHAVNGVMNFLTPPKSSNPVEISKLAEYEKCMKYTSNDNDTCKALLSN